MNRSQLPEKLTATAADVKRIRQALFELDAFAESVTVWVPADAFAAWAKAIGATVMHTMTTDSGFAWCTNDASGADVRIVVHTRTAPAPWVTFPPRGSEDTKRFKMFIEVKG